MAAIDLGVGAETAVRTKQVRERVRGKAGGAFGRDKEARALRKREAGRLTLQERGELLLLWSGHGDALGVRSAQGAVEAQLLRAPPRIGEELELEVARFLSQGMRKRDGAERDRLVAMLVSENVGATAYEARLALRRMAGAGRVEVFTKDVPRKRECVCKSPMGEYEGSSPGAPGSPRKNAECSCGAGQIEMVPTRMVRLSGAGLRESRSPSTPEERWARRDAELEAYCRELSVGESSRSGGSRLPPAVRDAAEGVRATLGCLSREHARVIELAYGPVTTRYAGLLSEEAGRLAPVLACVERARQELVKLRVAELGRRGDAEATATVDRSTYATDALRRKLDAAPVDELGRARWTKERAAFVEAIEAETRELLKDAVEAFRTVRGT